MPELSEPVPSPRQRQDVLDLAGGAFLCLALAGLFFSMALVNVGMWAAVLCVAAHGLRRPAIQARPARELLGPLGLALAAYIAALALTAALGIRPAESLRELPKTAVFLLLFLTAHRVRRRGALKPLLVAMALGSTYAAGFAIYEHFHPGEWKHQALATGRVAGPASDTIDFSARLTPALAVGSSIALFAREPAVAATATGWCALVALALAFTQTRANLAALVAGLAATALLTRRAPPVVLLLVLVALALWPNAPIATRYRTIASTQDPSNQYRFDVLRVAATIAARHFPWGTGRGNFGVVHDGLKSPDQPSKLSAHNNYVDLLCETGVLGLAAFLAIHAAFLGRTVCGLGALAAGSLEHAAALGSIQAFVTFMAFGLFHSNWTYALPPAVLMSLMGIGWGLASGLEPERGA
ncbi:MAG: O-antigen ligase family protein [Candidatus Wallbacteria bacterium]|nr:O-antigen ligase family protein [Candidatus Wallbacteria bacterium]